MSGVQDILQNRELFHVEENDTVANVVRRMAEIRVGAILVLEGEQLRGVFSERDLMKRVVLERLDPELTLVKDVMSTDIATIDEAASLEEAMEAMHAHNCRHVPVTRGSRVVAFLSMRDLMHHELARKTEEWHHMQEYIRSAS
jgi:CBS domain-containing protein